MARARLARVGGGIGWRGAGRRLGWRGMVAGSALALAAAVAGAAAAPAQAAPAGIRMATGKIAAKTGGTACDKAVGPFSVSGTQVLAADKKPFISYGLTVAGLQSPSWATNVPEDLQEIAATASGWCGNTVRLQLNQDDLLGPYGTSFSRAYMAAIESEVAMAKSYQLVVVLNDETNIATAAEQAVQRGPTPATETFWKDLAKVYGKDPQVIFDLFNEPRTYSAGMSLAQEWQLWLDGGTFNGVPYLGMAQLAAYVRTIVKARNLFWVEGPNFSQSFAGMVQQDAVLHVSGVVYALHHPAGAANTGSWDDDFGYLIQTNVAPVVEGEWTNYEPMPPSTAVVVPAPSSCWPNAPTAVPAFLDYLGQHGIGLNAYTLQPGFMIQSYSNLADPTTMSATTWTCQSDAETQPGQGAGSDVLAWFHQQDG